MISDDTPTSFVVALAGRTIGREADSAPFGEALVQEHWLQNAGDLRLATADHDTWFHTITLPGRLRIALHSVLTLPAAATISAAARAVPSTASSPRAAALSPSPAAAPAPAPEAARAHLPSAEQHHSVLGAASEASAARRLPSTPVGTAAAAAAAAPSPLFGKLCAALLAAPGVELAGSEAHLRSKLPEELKAEAVARTSTAHAVALEAWHEAWA